jgi:hypothetical protein
MFKKVFCVLAAFAVLLSGCGFNGKTASKDKLTKSSSEVPSSEIAQSSKIVVVGIDRTGSFYPNIEKGFVQKAVASFFRDNVHPGDDWYFRWISNNSYDVEAIVSGLEHIKVPSGDVKNTNVFDIRQALQARENEESLRKVMNYVKVKLERLKTSAVYGTDIFGFFKKAESILNSSDKSEKWIVVFSDLEDTVEDETYLRLKGVKVFIYHAGKYAKFAEKTKKMWVNTLTDSGAQVVLRDLSEAIGSDVYTK